MFSSVVRKVFYISEQLKRNLTLPHSRMMPWNWLLSLYEPPSVSDHSSPSAQHHNNALPCRQLVQFKTVLISVAVYVIKLSNHQLLVIADATSLLGLSGKAQGTGFFLWFAGGPKPLSFHIPNLISRCRVKWLWSVHICTHLSGLHTAQCRPAGREFPLSSCIFCSVFMKWSQSKCHTFLQTLICVQKCYSFHPEVINLLWVFYYSLLL